MPVPIHKPHPAKPRMHPTPAPVPGTPNNNGSNNNGTGQNNNHDWPRAEFRSSDQSTG